jgi:hypothetical protein
LAGCAPEYQAEALDEKIVEEANKNSSTLENSKIEPVANEVPAMSFPANGLAVIVGGIALTGAAIAPVGAVAIPKLLSVLGVTTGLLGLQKAAGGASISLGENCAYLPRIGITEPYTEQDVLELEVMDDVGCANWVRSRIESNSED